MSDSIHILKENLAAFKRKYYLNLLIKNTLIFAGVILSIYFLINSLEFTFNLGTTSRTALFYTTAVVLLGAIYVWLVKPSIKYFKSNDHLSDQDAAKQIANYFPNIGDKLLNTIQLETNSTKSLLLSASIHQRSQSLSIFNFSQGINLKQNNKYIKYVLIPSLLIFVILLFVPQFFTESTARIVNYDKEFESARLFQFNIDHSQLNTYRNEDFHLRFGVTGEAIPDLIYVMANGRRYKMNVDERGQATFTFNKVQKSFDFTILASDYKSHSYHVNVLSRPDIQGFNIKLDYPAYTGLTDESFSNVGNLTLPEGTSVEWTVQTHNTEQIDFYFENKLFESQAANNQLFDFKKQIGNSTNYQLKLSNKHGTNKDSIVYNISVNKDQFPRLSLDYYQDTTLYSYIVLNGLIDDDYGISALELVYTKNQQSETVALPFSRKLTSQNIFYQWALDSIRLREGDRLDFFVRVWDNDRINGRKATKSSTYSLVVPDAQEIDEKIEKQAASARSELDKTQKEAEDLNNQIKKIQDELKSKKEIDWKDNKRIQDLIDQKKELEKDLNKLSQEHKSLQEQREHFKQPNEKLQEKARQLQQLMEDVLDEETKAMYEELQKLLQENSDQEQVENMMDKIQKKEANMQKEIDRAIEMLKRMLFDFKMDDIINDLEKLEQKQTEAAKETSDKDADLEKQAAQQKEQMEAFEDIKEDLEKLEELNEDLKNPEELESLEREKDEIEKEMSESLDQLEQKNKKKASESQQKASGQMKEMKKKMQDMQAGMEMEMLNENLQNLRDIVDNLVKLSFDQEAIMDGFRGVNQSDPRYVTLSQDQLKLKDDAVIIEDSLLSLASRVFQIQSFVTREVDEMNDHIESSLQSLKDRHKSEAVSYQQYAMTSINNLALLLDDVLQQMMQQMADAMGKPQKGKKGKEQKMPALSELQKQLNNKIEELQKSGKTGRPLSQQLAELAAEQEMLRQEMKKMEEKMGKEGGNGKEQLSEAIKKMEQTEQDLVYKRLNRQTINRQQEILTRMLEAEKSMQERELDKKRKGEEAKEIEKSIPPAFEEYFKAKEKELELLHSVPSKMSPYYKEEVNKYFKRLNEQ